MITNMILAGLLTQLTLAGNGLVEPRVPFTFAGESLVVVPAFINGHGPYRFLVDTGANHSILSNKIANELKLPVESNKMLSTSGSRVPIKIRLVECLQIGGTPITQTEIATTDWEILRSLHVDGIIGADYLKRFKISIDYGRKLLTIEP